MLSRKYSASDHPLAHLMQSIFGLHDATAFDVHVYSTGGPSDGSACRKKIESESASFKDLSTCTTKEMVETILKDGIHIRK